MTPKGELLSLNLESGRLDTVATGVVLAALGPDETLFAVDGKRRVLTVARRIRVVWPQPLAAVPRELFGATDQRLVAVLPGDAARPFTVRLETVAADQPPAARTMPLAGDAAATRRGGPVLVAGHSG